MACKRDFSDHYPYHPPEKIPDGLNVGTAQQVGMDQSMIAKAVGRIDAGKYGQVHSLLIYKDSLLVVEEYFKGNRYKWDGLNYHGERIQWGKEEFHVIMSCTKSITSTCLGIAIDKGYIRSVDELIFDYLPDHQRFRTKGKDQIRIEHLLTMTSGLQWDEWGPHRPSSNDIDRIYYYCQSDPIACVLAKDLEHEPGKKFTYNGGGMIILGEILRNATNMTIEDFAKLYLFEPLEIDSTYWYRFEDGTYASDGSVRMTSRDMVKFGVTFLDKGIWKGQTVLSKNWVKMSQTVYKNNSGINIPGDDSGKNGYAYSWWTNKISGGGKSAKLFQAGGWGGQAIIVIPNEKMVVVFTGGNYTSKTHLYEILERFILPSIKL